MIFDYVLLCIKDNLLFVQVGEGICVELQGIVKSYVGNWVLYGVDFDIVFGEFVFFLGFLGCGKIMLLCVFVGFEGVDEGVVFLGGGDVFCVLMNKCDIGMVFQLYLFFLYLWVVENIVFGLW